MSGHVVESTSELSAFMKAGVMAGSERDTGFSSGGDEDDMSGLHSPSASEDSVEVQVTPISLRNKRKLAEPRKIQEPNTAPLKKRRFEQIEETAVPDEDSRRIRSPSPFRPWSTSSKANEPKTLSGTTTTTTTTASTTIGSSVTARAPSPTSPDLERSTEEIWRNGEARIQEGFPPRLRESELLLERPESPAGCAQTSLGQRRESSRQKLETTITSVPMSVNGNALPTSSSAIASLPLGHPRLQEEPLSLVLRGEIARVPSHPAVSGCYERASSTYSMEHANLPSSSPGSSHHHQNHQSGSSGSTVSNGQTSHSRQHQTAGGQQRNYKNMTRERRIEANARERTRVHTISAAFDTLRRAIPAYSHNQKLSKLSVLRIACSYIMTLGKIVNTPEGQSANGAALGACVDLVSRTIQTEGKLRKRKED